MRAMLAALLILLSLPSAHASTPGSDLDTLLARLAQPTPASTPFIEQRESALLSAPLVLHGRLEQPDADTLIRLVESPYHERSTIRAERVELEREGQPTRRFALRRAPELGALLDSFRALLSGQRALLERHYTVELDGSIDGDWQLSLSPLESRRQQRIVGIELFGNGATLACLMVRQADGGSSHMLLDAEATATDPPQDLRFAQRCSLPDATP